MASLLGCGLLFAATAAQAGLTAAAKCEALKNKEAGKYAFCLEKAQMKLVKTKGACSTTTALACYRDDECPPGETCAKDTTKYDELVTKCDTKLTEHWSKWETKAGGSCPTTGDEASVQTQLTTYTDRMGARLSGQRFVDNGDGTVTDTKTGLMWEKKDSLDNTANYSDPHDADNTYTWSSSSTAPDGTAFTNFLAALNNGTSSDGTATTGCFANHCDWRLPTVEELAGIADCSNGSPCIDPAFGPTQSLFYWSASTNTGFPSSAWVVAFSDGSAGYGGKSGTGYVRAVRGGF